jgi:hypothetical protein
MIESTPMTERIVVTQLPGVRTCVGAARALDHFGTEVLSRLN